jgi:hypothetical protein
MVQFKSVAMVAVALIAIFGTQAIAQERMRPIATLKFVPEPLEMERGTFTINAADRRMRSMRLSLKSGSADVRSLFLNYVDGDVERVRVQEAMRAGAQTGIIRLPERKPIRSVEVTYIPVGEVVFELLADAVRPAPPPEWRELGCRNVGFLVDRDSMSISSPEKFKALRLRSSGLDIDMIEMAVRFGNGARDIYPIRTVIPSGGRTSAIDLRGEARVLRQIELVYRTRGLSTAKTKLCVDGLSSVPEFEE